MKLSTYQVYGLFDVHSLSHQIVDIVQSRLLLSCSDSVFCDDSRSLLLIVVHFPFITCSNHVILLCGKMFITTWSYSSCRRIRQFCNSNISNSLSRLRLFISVDKTLHWVHSSSKNWASEKCLAAARWITVYVCIFSAGRRYINDWNLNGWKFQPYWMWAAPKGNHFQDSIEEMSTIKLAKIHKVEMPCLYNIDYINRQTEPST